MMENLFFAQWNLGEKLETKQGHSVFILEGVASGEAQPSGLRRTVCFVLQRVTCFAKASKQAIETEPRVHNTLRGACEWLVSDRSRSAAHESLNAEFFCFGPSTQLQRST
jgi:hypothetical protein